MAKKIFNYTVEMLSLDAHGVAGRIPHFLRLMLLMQFLTLNSMLISVNELVV